MASIRLDKKLEARLEHLSSMTNRTKSFYVRESLLKYLDDMEDLYLSLERITTKNRKFYSTEEVLKKLKNV
ncbi:MAG: DUF6290 family protein [Rickettsiaceae bacterium]|nr:DUF6290 family protein [Rickettsiaceae bacterium]